MRSFIFTLFLSLSIITACSAREPSKASESIYNKNILKARTSSDLTKADLAWHAKNTYGWDCDEVVSKGELTSSGFYAIKCSSGKELKVYPRKARHPKIIDAAGHL